MATLADELLNDFEDSGSDQEADTNGVTEEDGSDQTQQVGQSFHLELDGDEEEDDEDEELAARNLERLDTVDGEDDKKAQVEKMRLGGVRDVRSVAGLMKTLQPVLEVSPETDFHSNQLHSFTTLPKQP